MSDIAGALYKIKPKNRSADNGESNNKSEDLAGMD